MGFFSLPTDTAVEFARSRGCQITIEHWNVSAACALARPKTLQMWWCIVDYLRGLSRVRLNWGLCFPTAAHQLDFQIRVLETNRDVSPLAGFSAGWSKTATQGWHILTRFMWRERGTSALLHVFHLAILFIRSVADATLDHNTYMMLPLTSPRGLFQTVCCAMI